MTLPANARAVVTGAGSGLGRALCQELARREVRVLASDIDGDGARSHGGPELMDTVRELMVKAKLQADGVARAALDGVARGELHIVPHADGRWLWRLKRLSPKGFQRLTPKLLAWRAARRRGGINP